MDWKYENIYDLVFCRKCLPTFVLSTSMKKKFELLSLTKKGEYQLHAIYSKATFNMKLYIA